MVASLLIQPNVCIFGIHIFLIPTCMCSLTPYFRRVIVIPRHWRYLSASVTASLFNVCILGTPHFRRIIVITRYQQYLSTFVAASLHLLVTTLGAFLGLSTLGAFPRTSSFLLPGISSLTSAITIYCLHCPLLRWVFAIRIVTPSSHGILLPSLVGCLFIRVELIKSQNIPFGLSSFFPQLYGFFRCHPWSPSEPKLLHRHLSAPSRSKP